MFPWPLGLLRYARSRLRATPPSLADMSARDDADRAALVALLRERPQGMRWQQTAMEVADTGSARALWERLWPPSLFGQDDGTDPLVHAMTDIVRWRRAGFGFLTLLDDEYPSRLREIRELPPVLFYRGTLSEDTRAVSVVGSRKASPQGTEIARTVAEALVERGITVIGGLAAGIDTAAHQAALDAGGRTVAIIGTGIARVYPAENRDLQERIAEEGLVLSQFWPDTPPRKQNFPMRNAVMSGYGQATVVVEAGEASGARIQARLAVEHGRPVILTDLVASSTEWGKRLVGRPGVHVAKGTRGVLAVIDDIVRTGEAVGDFLATVRA